MFSILVYMHQYVFSLSWQMPVWTFLLVLVKIVFSSAHRASERSISRASNSQTTRVTTIGIVFLFRFCLTLILFFCLTCCATGVTTMLLATGEKSFVCSSCLECLVLRVWRFGVLPSRVTTDTFFFPLDLFFRVGFACFFRPRNHSRILASQTESALSNVSCEANKQQKY